MLVMWVVNSICWWLFRVSFWWLLVVMVVVSDCGVMVVFRFDSGFRCSLLLGWVMILLFRLIRKV